jgi:hypothetical protein
MLPKDRIRKAIQAIEETQRLCAKSPGALIPVEQLWLYLEEYLNILREKPGHILYGDSKFDGFD